MQIKAVMRDTFGTMRTYCMNPEQAEALQVITGQKTLTKNTIKGLRMLGVEVEVINPYIMEEHDKKQ